MSFKSIPNLKTQINTLLPDNSTAAISAADVRTNMLDAADSLAPVDHTHTNAEVNTSIATNPAASATAMGLGTANTPTFAGLKTTGRVGIGTTAPARKLSVFETGEQLELRYDANNFACFYSKSNSDLQVYTYNGTGYGNIILGVDGVNPAGNVGIGTASPSAKLQVKADSATLGGEIKITNDQSTVSIGQSAAISFGREFDDRTVRLSSVSTGAYGTYPDFVVTANKNASGSSHTELLRVKNNGNVGIGTTSPSDKLEVAGNINVAGSSARIGFNAGNMAVKDEGGYKLGFQTYNSTSGTITTKMVLDTNGNVGIGTTSPANKLDIRQGTSSGSDVLGVGAISIGSDNPYWTFRGTAISLQDLAFDRSYGGTWYESMRIQRSSGNVGIGTTTPAEKLDVVGNITASGTVQTGSLTVAVATELSSATAVAAGAGAMTYISNESGGATIAFSDGTVWRRVSDRAPIS
jgi:hypothetical protein